MHGTARLCRIAVVDDDEDSARTLAEFLEDEGHEVAVAFDGLAALELVKRSRPDVVLLDLSLPEIDGYEVARQLRRERASVVLIALTGYGREEDRRRAREAGFDHHLVKPLSLEALAEILDRLCATRS